MAKTKDLGVVYVLTNSMMPGIVKIGMTLRYDVKQRMNELYGTGVPLPFKCEFACSIDADRCKELEHALHVAFGPYRINPNREFFQIEPYQAVELLKFIDKGATDLTKEVSEDITEDLTEADKEALQTDEAKNKPRRPPLNFVEMKIPLGATLVYVKDNSVTCEVYTERKVKFNDEVTSLSAITKKLLNTVHAPQPTPHWMYNGRNLQDIYDETYPFTEE